MNTQAARALKADQAAHRILETEARKDLIRFITCGSVDDGKSTLIGRLLYDSQMIYEDQLAALVTESQNRPVTEGGLDFSLLVDGLQAEREQGITIDVAYRFFSSGGRKFIVADTPGHEQYTRNMATGASSADLAVILMDARKGVLTQTRRHAFIATLLGIRSLAVVINKMDLVDYDQARFDALSADFRAFADRIGAPSVTIIPISALKGENVARRSEAMGWYTGPTLLEHLETAPVERVAARTLPLRFPVQWVNRPFDDFRGFAGTLASGQMKPGDTVRVMRSGQEAAVARLVTFDGDQTMAVAGDAITVVLDREIDISRGDVLVPPTAPTHQVNQFQAKLIWMSDSALMAGRSHELRLGTQTLTASVTDVKYAIDVNTLDHTATKTLTLNQLGVVNVATDLPVSFDAYADNRTMGSFILVDRVTGETLGAGMIDHPLSRAANVQWQGFDVDRAARARQLRQEPAIVWLTGLSGSGKSTIANIVEKRLYALGRASYVLDGDNVRHGLNKDLGFTDADRVENIRRVAEVARLMADAGLIVLVSFISPFRAERDMARRVAGDIAFHEVFVSTSLDTCEARDPKGLYAKARRGEIRNFTGLSSPYEAPLKPDLTLDTTELTAEAAAELVLARIAKPI
jgi:bifunctional enzyme CysN/CysC